MIINLSNINFAGGGGGMSADDEFVIAYALEDLNGRLTDVEHSLTTVENNNNENPGA